MEEVSKAHSFEGVKNTDPTSLITDNLDIWTSAIQAKSASGRGSGKKLDLYGIKKLRELILELAVRGKLVPQDPSDEPASVLLERIAAEKANLVAEKKMRKQKLLPEISEREKLFELPQGWVWAKLGNLSTDIHYGYTASAKSENEGVRLLRITDIQNDRVNWATVPVCEIDEKKLAGYLLQNDDILIARTGGTIGKSYLVEGIDLQAVFASYLIRVQRISSMYAPFLKTYLGSQLYWRQLYDNASGTGQPNVNATALKSLVVSIPPVNEQHRIVAKVDELMALCDQLEQQTETSIDAHATLVETLLATLTGSTDAADVESAKDDESAETARDSFDQNWTRIAEHFDTLFTTEHSIEQLKQTILQLAVMGKLVPQDPNDEPAAVLLEKIAAEKARLVKEKKIKKQKPLPSISEDEKSFKLPETWIWSRLGNLGIGSTGKTPSTKNPEYFEGSIPFIGPGQITTSGEMLEADKFLSEQGLTCSSEANLGDVLMVCIGGSIGKSVVVSNKIGFNQQINAISPIFVNSSYLQSAMSTGCFYRDMLLKATGSATPIINRGKWEQLCVPLPPESEQIRIVEKVDQLMAICDQFKVRLQQSQQTQLHLADAMVGKAMDR